jgi:hypothetical protein
MLQQLIYVLIIGVIAGIIWWVCDFLPIPEPLNRLIKILTVVVAAIAIIVALASLAGVSLPR